MSVTEMGLTICVGFKFQLHNLVLGLCLLIFVRIMLLDVWSKAWML